MPRWTRRLQDLLELDAEDLDGGAPADPAATDLVTKVLTSLDAVGFATEPLRLFLSEDGSFNLRHRQGQRVRSLDVYRDRFEFNDVDLETGASAVWDAQDWQVAAAALVAP